MESCVVLRVVSALACSHTLPLLWHRASHKKERVPPALVARGAAFDADVWHNAVVLVDKPDGWSSSNVCSKLRGVMRVKKVWP